VPFALMESDRQSELNGSGPDPMKAIFWGGVGVTAWRAASSRRVRSM